MAKGKVQIEIDRAWEGCRWIWEVWLEGEFYKSGIEDTAKAAMDAVLLTLRCTPEQAIAATLGSEREKALEEMVRDLMKFTDRYIGIPLGDEADFFDEVERLNERMDELGIEVDE